METTSGDTLSDVWCSPFGCSYWHEAAAAPAAAVTFLVAENDDPAVSPITALAVDVPSWAAMVDAHAEDAR